MKQASASLSIAAVPARLFGREEAVMPVCNRLACPCRANESGRAFRRLLVALFSSVLVVSFAAGVRQMMNNF